MIRPLRGTSRTAAITLIEVLVAGAIVVVVLGISAVFLGRQTTLQRAVQARNEVQDRVRVSMQLVTQDLALAGNRVLVSADGTATEEIFGCFDPDDDTTSCLTVSSADATTSEIELRYLSSQFPSTESCRDVAYRVTADDVLQRSDVVCPSVGIADPQYVDLASGVLAVKAVVLCSNGTRYETFPPPSGCTSGTAYGRSALVSIVAASRIPTPNASSSETYPVVTTDPDAPTSVACPTDRKCFGLTQETHMPNLKDQ